MRINMYNFVDSFFGWCRKHDFFISGTVVSLNLISSIQSFEKGDNTLGYISLVIAFAIWYIYFKNVNKEEPK